MAQVTGSAFYPLILEVGAVACQAVINWVHADPVWQYISRRTVATFTVEVIWCRPVMGFMAQRTASMARFQDVGILERAMATGAVVRSEYRGI